jgi:MFS family permease
MTLVLTIVICAAAVLGLIAGLVKGFDKSSAWGAVVLLAVLLARLLTYTTQSFSGNGLFILVAAVGSLLLLMLIFALLKKLVKKQLAKAYQLYEYKTYDEQEENKERILNALDAGDKKEYKKNVSRKFKKKAGGWGVFNRILGGVVVALNTVMCFALIISFLLVLVGFAQIPSLTELFAEALASDAWLNLGLKLVFDLFFMVLLYACIKMGYKGGISGALCTLIILAMLGGAGYLANYIAFNTETFASLAAQMVEGGLGETLNSVASAMSALGVTAETLAKIILMVGLFVLFLIVVIIFGIFLPKLVNRLKEGKAFQIVDGVLGAVVLTAIVFGILLFVGGVLSTLSDLEFMSGFNECIQLNYIANSLYGYNPLASLGILDNLPFRGWFTKAEVQE